jgi:hypothetical protein
MQVDVSPVTSATLQEDGTIRCLADVKYQPVPDSRHSSTAFALAKDLANDITTALLAQLGQVTATHSESLSPANTNTAEVTTKPAPWQLYAVQLHRNRMRVCFDVFLDRCTPELRRQMDETAARPIHAVIKLGDNDRYQVDRRPPLDARVAGQIAHVQECDEGPRPYFTDSMIIMTYDDGVRVEDNLEELFPDLAGPARFRAWHRK